MTTYYGHTYPNDKTEQRWQLMKSHASEVALRRQSLRQKAKRLKATEAAPVQRSDRELLEEILQNTRGLARKEQGDSSNDVTSAFLRNVIRTYSLASSPTVMTIGDAFKILKALHFLPNSSLNEVAKAINETKETTMRYIESMMSIRNVDLHENEPGVPRFHLTPQGAELYRLTPGFD